MQPRTKRQKEVLDYIKQHIDKHGYEPSYQQIARGLRVASKAGIAKHIEALEKQGLISRIRENNSFRLELTNTKSLLDLICEIEWLEIPKDEEETEDFENKPLFIPKFMLGHNSPEVIKAFRVMDDSMADENIFEGDIALIKVRSYARDGDCVVALSIESKAIIANYYRVGADIELRPANDRFETIKLPADKIIIKGIFRGLLRPLI